MRILHSICAKGVGAINEDSFGAQPGKAWVLDGASGLGTDRFTRGVTDARWYVDVLQGLISNAPTGYSAASILQDVATSAASCFRLEADTFGALPPGKEYAPSSSVILLSGSSSGVTYCMVGDCSLIYASQDGSIRYVRDTAVSSLEDPILRRYAEAKAEYGDDDVACRDAVRPLLRSMRTKMNAFDGYSVLSAAMPRWCGGQSDAIADWNGDPIVLISDGVSRAIDLFGLRTPAALYNEVCYNGFDGLMRELREIEDSDWPSQKYIRLKRSDDATGVVVVPE